MHALSFVSMGVEERCCPSKSTAHCRHMKRQPFLCNGCPCHGCCHCHRRHHLHPHRHCCCHWPLPLRLPSTIAATIFVALLSAIAVAIALAVGHCCLCHRRPSQLPLPSDITVAMPSVISESCCLGAARIVFNQLKQRMLTSFYFVRTVGSALIEARWLTRCQAAMANTSVGWQAASSERPETHVAAPRGAHGGQKGGDID